MVKLMRTHNKIVNIGKNLNELRIDGALMIMQYESDLFTKKRKRA